MNSQKPNRANIGDYLEQGYIPHGLYLDESSYSRMLDTIVIACLDIAPVYKNEMLIAKRTRPPQADWWLIGGRLRAGEHLASAATRILKTDLDLDYKTTTFNYLTTFSAAWTKRAHEPENNGTHTLSVVMSVDLGTEDIKSITLSEEYSEFKLMPPDKILQGSRYHQALQQCASALLLANKTQ